MSIIEWSGPDSPNPETGESGTVNGLHGQTGISVTFQVAPLNTVRDSSSCMSDCVHSSVRRCRLPLKFETDGHCH